MPNQIQSKNIKIKKIAILGSTGSIGTQTLDIVRTHKDKFDVKVLTTNTNIELLNKQIKEFNPELVCITNLEKFEEFKKTASNIKVINSLEDIFDLLEINLVITAIVGSCGLKPTLKAIEKGIDIGLANKETLVVAGEIVMRRAKENNVKIFPIDSEHSAIWQSLEGNDPSKMENIWLTCSGGPFKGRTRDFLEKVTLEDALNHPTWNMGGKITIDSSTLMNKGLEVIEACHLFNIAPEKIKVVIHPQSIIHSMVEYIDGNIIAQLGPPDMRLPIQYAMCYPERLKNDFKRINFYELKELTFLKPDLETFIPLKLAFKAIEMRGIMPAVLNSSNEILVSKFLKKEINYIDIFNSLEQIFNSTENILNPNIDQLIEADLDTRKKTLDLISNS